MFDERQVLDERFAHGIRTRLVKQGNLFIVEDKHILCSETEIYYINSDESDATLWYWKYHHALLYGFEENPELILPYPWMYEIGEPDEDEEDDIFAFLFDSTEPF